MKDWNDYEENAMTTNQTIADRDLTAQGQAIRLRADQIRKYQGAGKVLVDPLMLARLLHDISILASNPDYWRDEPSMVGRLATVADAHKLAASIGDTITVVSTEQTR